MLQFNFLSRLLSPHHRQASKQIDSFCCSAQFFSLHICVCVRVCVRARVCMYARVFVRARLRSHDGYPSLAVFVALLCPALSTLLPWLSQCLEHRWREQNSNPHLLFVLFFHYRTRREWIRRTLWTICRQRRTQFSRCVWTVCVSVTTACC